MYIDREKRTGGGERERASPDHARLILTCFVPVNLTLSENLGQTTRERVEHGLHTGCWRYDIGGSMVT